MLVHVVAAGGVVACERDEGCDGVDDIADIGAFEGSLMILMAYRAAEFTHEFVAGGAVSRTYAADLD